VYSEDSHDPFPEDLDMLCLATALDLNDFCVQAAIVNYYHMDSMLSGLTDHSESNKDVPLFSFR
jgi:alkylated DNA repair protein alkB family protein 1